MSLFPALRSYIAERTVEFDRISEQRQQSLREPARYLTERLEAGRPARLTFVCTHNSRRSQIARIWAAAAADHYGIERVETFSGGTQATAFDRRAVQALQRAGFEIERESDGDNPVYQVRFGDHAPTLRAFSKLYDRAPNPTEDFCALMTCASADANCPVVPGASLHVSIPHDDPGDSDGTRREVEAYDRCCRRISREMLYLFSLVRA